MQKPMDLTCINRLSGPSLRNRATLKYRGGLYLHRADLLQLAGAGI
jgi:hypothetical protein